MKEEWSWKMRIIRRKEYTPMEGVGLLDASRDQTIIMVGFG